MTTAEKTLKWWNDHKEMNGTYPLIAEIEAQLQMAVDEEKLVKVSSVPDVVVQSEQLEDFVKYLQDKYGVLLDQYTETVVEKYKSSN